MSKTYLDHADTLPPILVRIAARKKYGRSLMTNDEIAKASGLPRKRVMEISRKTSWRGCRIDEIDAFLKGCGLSAFDRRTTFEYLRRRKFGYIKSLPKQQQKFVMRLFEIMKEDGRRKKTAPEPD